MAGMSRRTEVTEVAPIVAPTDYSALATWPAVRDCARFLRDEKAQEVQILHVSARASFADFFIIATAQSWGHLRGLVKNLDEVLAKYDIRAKGGKRAINEDDTWVLLDCGDIIIHLMMPEAREFYDLEKLWFDSPRLIEAI